ncbi:MAG TPA: NAD(P)-dependent alcohol dehydrogenase [Vicinamibacteria bacterium]
MKAVQYRKFGPPEVLEWTEAREPRPRPDQALVRVAAASLNPKDVLVRKGRFRWLSGRRFPRGCGYDFAGTVVASGLPPGVGDEVFGMLNGWAGGSHAELVAVPVDELALRPAFLPLEDCAALPLVGLTALQALRDLGCLGPGGAVLVNGASGGVGTVSVQIARALGARVTGVCSARNHELVASLGAAEVVDYAATDLRSLRGPFDVVFDVFGNRSFAELGDLLTPDGAYVTTVPSPTAAGQHALSYLRPGRKAWMVAVRSNAADLRTLAQMADEGLLRPVIDRRYALAESAEAHRYLETRRARGKVLLVP